MQSNRVLRRTVLAGALAGIAAVTTAAGPAFADDPTGSISGVVRDTHGAVVADAAISVYLNPSSGPVQELEADAHGRFSVTGLKVGSYQVQIGMEGWSEWAPGRISNPDQARSYRVTADHNTVVNSIVTAAGIISGKILGPDGKPAANAPVYVTNVNTASENGGQAAADGTYRVRVQPNQTFRVSYEIGPVEEFVPHTFDPAEATEYFVRSGQTVQVNDQALPISGVTGRLTDAAGAPAGSVYVTVFNVATTVESEAETTADGTYDFSGLLAPGQYKVRFNADGQTQYAHQKPDYDSADVITVAPGETAVVDDQLLWVHNQ